MPTKWTDSGAEQRKQNSPEPWRHLSFSTTELWRQILTAQLSSCVRHYSLFSATMVEIVQ